MPDGASRRLARQSSLPIASSVIAVWPTVTVVMVTVVIWPSDCDCAAWAGTPSAIHAACAHNRVSRWNACRKDNRNKAKQQQRVLLGKFAEAISQIDSCRSERHSNTPHYRPSGTTSLTLPVPQGTLSSPTIPTNDVIVRQRASTESLPARCGQNRQCWQNCRATAWNRVLGDAWTTRRCCSKAKRAR